MKLELNVGMVICNFVKLTEKLLKSNCNHDRTYQNAYPLKVTEIFTIKKRLPILSAYII